MLYKRGDIIMQNQPWVFVVNEQFVEKCCHHCLNNNIVAPVIGQQTQPSLHRCSSCRFAYFCGQRCQKASWKDHKFECHVLGQFHQKQSSGLDAKVPDAHIRLALRVFRKYLLKDLSQTPDSCTPPSRRTFLDLWTHEDQVKESPSHMNTYKSLNERIRNMLLSPNELPQSDEQLLPIYSRININAHTMYDGNGHALAVGVFLGISSFDHSCRPNADFMLRQGGTTLCVTALEDIADISMVRLAYCDTFEPTALRRAFLQQHYFFHCECPGCLDTFRDNQMRSVTCPEKDCAGAVPLDAQMVPSGPCSVCAKPRLADDMIIGKSRDLMMKIPEVLGYSTQAAQDHVPDSTSLKAMFVCLRTLFNQQIKGVLHPLHYSYFKFVQHMFNYYPLSASTNENEDEDTERDRQQWFRDCITAYRAYHPISSTLGVRLVMLGEYLALKDQFGEANECFKEADGIMRLTFGTNHLMYKRLQMSTTVSSQFQIMQKLFKV